MSITVSRRQFGLVSSSIITSRCMKMLKVNWSLLDCNRLKKMLPSESVAAIILTRGAIENAGTEFVLPLTCHLRLRKSDMPSYI